MKEQIEQALVAIGSQIRFNQYPKGELHDEFFSLTDASYSNAIFYPDNISKVDVSSDIYFSIQMKDLTWIFVYKNSFGASMPKLAKTE